MYFLVYKRNFLIGTAKMPHPLVAVKIKDNNTSFIAMTTRELACNAIISLGAENFIEWVHDSKFSKEFKLSILGDNIVLIEDNEALDEMVKDRENFDYENYFIMYSPFL